MPSPFFTSVSMHADLDEWALGMFPHSNRFGSLASIATSAPYFDLGDLALSLLSHTFLAAPAFPLSSSSRSRLSSDVVRRSI